MSNSSRSCGTWYEELYWTHVRQVKVKIFRLQNIMPNELGNQETHNHIAYVYTKGSRARPTSRAYSNADPGLVCPTSASTAAAAAAAVAAASSAAAAVAAAAAAAATGGGAAATGGAATDVFFAIDY